MKILEAALRSDADHSYSHLHVTVSLADTDAGCATSRRPHQPAVFHLSVLDV